MTVYLARRSRNQVGVTRAKAQRAPRECEGRKNLKLEIRNSKRIQMIEKHKIPNRLLSDFELRISDFDSVASRYDKI